LRKRYWSLCVRGFVTLRRRTVPMRIDASV
jgi:hypothetical protein